MKETSKPPFPQNQVNTLSLLGLLFIGLKLTGTIGWSWWWVLAPFWMPPAAILLGLAIAALIAARFS